MGYSCPLPHTFNEGSSWFVEPLKKLSIVNEIMATAIRSKSEQSCRFTRNPKIKVLANCGVNSGRNGEWLRPMYAVSNIVNRVSIQAMIEITKTCELLGGSFRSKVWQHFIFNMADGKSVKYSCTLCNSKPIAVPATSDLRVKSTFNLIRHLRRHHPDVSCDPDYTV